MQTSYSPLSMSHLTDVASPPTAPGAPLMFAVGQGSHMPFALNSSQLLAQDCGINLQVDIFNIYSCCFMMFSYGFLVLLESELCAISVAKDIKLFYIYSNMVNTHMAITWASLHRRRLFWRH